MSEPAIDKALSALHRLLNELELFDCVIRVRADGRVSIDFVNQHHHLVYGVRADVARDSNAEDRPDYELTGAFGSKWEAP